MCANHVEYHLRNEHHCHQLIAANIFKYIKWRFQSCGKTCQSWNKLLIHHAFASMHTSPIHWEKPTNQATFIDVLCLCYTYSRAPNRFRTRFHYGFILQTMLCICLALVKTWVALMPMRFYPASGRCFSLMETSRSFRNGRQSLERTLIRA